MATAFQFGQIVWAEMADANGVRKLRPAIIVTPDEQIASTAILDIVAISTQVPRKLPSDHVLLPWHRQGHPRTGLKRKCAAVCSWIGGVVPTDIVDVAGIVPGPVMYEIMARIDPNAGQTGP
jgi:mRNA interferase MazF